MMISGTTADQEPMKKLRVPYGSWFDDDSKLGYGWLV